MYYDGYQKLALWSELERRTNLIRERGIMMDIIDMASQKLDKISEVYPYYTIHTSIHSENIIRIMESLLGNRIENLSDIELVILILSAYIHDIGMYYDINEINSIKESDDFIIFLDENPSEYIKYKNAPELLPDIINVYCRCHHARRCRNFISELNLIRKTIYIDSFDILDKTATVCESHNDNVRSILNNDDLNSKLGYHSDMKFCAILLRLADCFDFDGSRTPEYMYHFLGIENKDKVCLDNWRRHLSSGGFQFGLENGNILGYCAEPDEPYVEYTIRSFLDEIEKELKECRDILNLCNEKWKDFKLPYGIDRQQINGRGYDYGEYTFTLKKEKILALFMGEQLYTDKFVFIREIMQNAIDTSSYRKFWEESRGAMNFDMPPIEIYDWVDEYANHYIRINDYGMGMSKKIIENYFLKVGESYYRSDDFEAEKLKIESKSKQKGNFQPISQFGIGFLSSFLICDSIEVYTCCRPIDDISNDIIRLSIKGIEDFYTMRLGKRATPMPNKSGCSERKEKYGTSIVFHLNPDLYDGNFDLEEQIKKYVFCPPVPIIINGKTLDYMDDHFIHTSMPPEERTELTEETNSDCITSLKNWLHKKSLPKLFIRTIPFDITALSLSPNLMGQGVFLYFDTDEPVKIKDDLFNRYYKFSLQYDSLAVTLSESINIYKFENIEKKLNNLLNNLQKILKQLTDRNYVIYPNYLTKISLYRNHLKEVWDNLNIYSFEKDIDSICNFFTNMKTKMETTFKKISGKGGNKECRKLLSESISFAEKILNEFQKVKKASLTDTRYHFSINLNMNKMTQDILNLLQKNNCALSYNGIIVPSKQINASKNLKYSNPDFLKFGIMFFIIELRNDLRPQLNLARSNVYKMEWSVYSNINIVIKKFFHSLKIYSTKEIFNILNSRMTFREVLEDRYIKTEWKNYKIIQTTNGPKSFYEIRDILYKNKTVELKGINRLYQNTTIDFFSICSYSLLQLEYNVLMIISDNNYYDGKCRVSLLENDNNRYNESFYAPLFFAEFEDENSNNILCYPNSPLNRKHPFSIWLLSVTPDLYHEHREYFNSIIKCFDELRFQNSLEITRRLNSILQQIDTNAPELKLDKNLVIHYSHHTLY